MVNAEKHKQRKYQIGALPMEDKKQMMMLVDKVINDTNDNPQIMIDGLKSLYAELTTYYNVLASRNNGSFFKIQECQRILEIYEHTFFIKDVIQNSYQFLKIDAVYIKAILSECDLVLNEFKNIQAKQNKNIDNKIYGGIFTVKQNGSIDGYNDYPKESFEDIIRLKEPIFHVDNGGVV